MGIYIKGMEMPKNCEECTLTRPKNNYTFDSVCVFTKVECSNIARQVNCPLTEVSEPHGRLIDADALADDLEADGKEFGDEMKLNCASWLRSNATPTVIESEVEK